MRLVITEPAAADLRGIVRYIAAENPAAAEEVYRKIIGTGSRLLEFPQMGKAGRVPDTRELTLPDVPYTLVYGVSREEVTILAVFHNKMDLNKRIEDRSGR